MIWAIRGEVTALCSNHERRGRCLEYPPDVPAGWTQLRGPSTAMALQESGIALLIPSTHPSVNPCAVHLQTLGNLTGRLPLDAEHDGLQPQGDTGRFVRLGSVAEGLEPLERS
jgi:hypothetical protein